MEKVGLYARVSTSTQDVARQIDEMREFAEREYPDAEVHEYADVISGVSDTRGEEYRRLRGDIQAGTIDTAVVHELSRLSRLGAGEIHQFIKFCLEHDTGVRDLEVGLDISLDDDIVDRAVSQMIAGVMGNLAEIEHKQKLRRIRSGIRAAQEAGKWTGRPPRGFTVEDGRLRVDPSEFLTIREALVRIANGDPASEVADDVGVPATTLRTLNQKRRPLYFHGDAADDRVQDAVDKLAPLDDPGVPDPSGEIAELRDRLDRLEQGLSAEER